MARILIPTTILNGESASSPIFIGTAGLKGISVEVPSVWTAADIVFDVSRDHTRRMSPETLTNWVRIDTSKVKITGILTNASTLYIAQPEEWMIQNYAWLRLVSVDTTDESAENQAADRVLVVGLLR